MSSLNDWKSMSSWGSPAAVPMFSLGDYGVSDTPTAVDPTKTSSMVLDKATLDGTNIFGANSKAGAWGDWGTVPSAAAPGGGLNDFFSGMFGTTKAPGWGGAALGAAQGLFSGYLGMKQYGLAKEKLAESKRQFELNYGAQKSLTNSQLEDRQRARVASNAGAYQSVGDYMDKNGVK